MPEGHTIHRLARDQNREFAGQALIVTSPQGRFATGAARLHGQLLNEIEPWGKHLFYRFGEDLILHIHLGLYGKYRYHDNPPPVPRGQVRLRAIGQRRSFDLAGPNCCELLTPDQARQICDRLGPDPLRSDSNPDEARGRVASTRRAIGAVLLDQRIFAGVGNIFRTEALFINRIHPELPANQLSERQFDGLWDSLTHMMKIGLRYNRIITVNLDQLSRPPSRLSAAERTNIYKSEICPACRGPVTRIQQAARQLFYCGVCQPPVSVRPRRKK